MSKSDPECAGEACGRGQAENGLLELISLIKEQNRLLQQIQASLVTTNNPPVLDSANESGDEHVSLLEDLKSQKWGSLGSFLLQYLHEDGPTELSAAHTRAFLIQAKSTYSQFVTNLKNLRLHPSSSAECSLDPSTIRAFDNQLSSWPTELSGTENYGLGRASSEDSNVYVHFSPDHGAHISLGSVWYVP